MMKKIFTLLLMIFILPLYAQQTHIVKKGETLYSLAREYKVSVKALADINHFSTETHIKIGQKLIIPLSATVKPSSKNTLSQTSFHIVKKGETLYGLSRKYKIPVEQIIKYNKIKNNTIFVGQKIFLHEDISKKSNTIVVVKNDNSQANKKNISENQNSSTNKQKAVIATASQIKSPDTSSKKKVVSSNKRWPARGDVYYFDGKIPGIQIAVKERNEIVSVCNGVIKTASIFRGYGHVVVVESHNKMLYTYAGFDTVNVKEGDSVKAGEKLGEADLNSKLQPCVYLFVYQNGTAINPVTVPRL